SEATTDYRFGEDDQILGTEDESYHENGLTDIATTSDSEENTDYDYTDYGTAIAAVPMANQIGYRAQMHDTYAHGITTPTPVASYKPTAIAAP
ncbi:hypothetical protein, partial [Paenilisteria newyorkensis]|uniref:hypothetical protein n=1 Tax=Listeria newyorkensis TaxID=1497681 RepID=UPI00163F117F